MITSLRNISEKAILRFVPLACFLGDLGIVAYFCVKMRNYDYFNKVLAVAVNNANTGFSVDDIDDQMKSELFPIFTFSLFFLLLLVVIFHLIIYILYMRKKELSRKYILSMAFVASLCLFYISLRFLFDYSWVWSLFCLSLGIIYGIVFLVTKELKFRQ